MGGKIKPKHKHRPIAPSTPKPKSDWPSALAPGFTSPTTAPDASSSLGDRRGLPFPLERDAALGGRFGPLLCRSDWETRPFGPEDYTKHGVLDSSGRREIAQFWNSALRVGVMDAMFDRMGERGLRPTALSLLGFYYKEDGEETKRPVALVGFKRGTAADTDKCIVARQLVFEMRGFFEANGYEEVHCYALEMECSPGPSEEKGACEHRHKK